MAFRSQARGSKRRTGFQAVNAHGHDIGAPRFSPAAGASNVIVPNSMLQQPIASGWQLLDAGNVAAAEAVVRPLLANGIPDELAPLIGAIRIHQERWSDAAPLLERAGACHPREARFAYLHGMALANTDRVAQAVPAFQAAIKQ